MKQLSVNYEFLNHFASIDWLSRCGKVDEFDLGLGLNFVKSWEEAEERDSSDSWEDLIAYGRQNMFEYITKKIGYSIREFNSLVSEINSSLQFQNAIRNIDSILVKKEVSAEIGETLAWILLNASIETTFVGQKGFPVFFNILYKTLNQGHCPCGWEGKWPRGTLYVY